MIILDDLALIILNYNSFLDTVSCVDKLMNFEMGYHIIIVDNCSTDESFRVIYERYNNYNNIDVIETSFNGGYSYGNNYGIRYAINKYKVNYVAILNPDVIIDNPDLLDKILDRLKNKPDIALMGASLINANNEYSSNFSGWNIPTPIDLIVDHMLALKRRNKLSTYNLIEENLASIDCVVGCFFVARVTALEEVDFFDENVFLYNEENILGIKLKKAGYKEAVLLDMFYKHNHKKNKKETSFIKKITATKYSYESTKYLCKKYYSSVLLPMLFLAEMFNRIYLAIAYIKNRAS